VRITMRTESSVTQDCDLGPIDTAASRLLSDPIGVYTSRLQRMVIAAAPGPCVADVVTAAGTMATAAGAIAIAVVSYWRERTHTRRHE
jgi:uncharacterized membrane protein